MISRFSLPNNIIQRRNQQITCITVVGSGWAGIYNWSRPDVAYENVDEMTRSWRSILDESSERDWFWVRIWCGRGAWYIRWQFFDRLRREVWICKALASDVSLAFKRRGKIPQTRGAVADIYTSSLYTPPRQAIRSPCDVVSNPDLPGTDLCSTRSEEMWHTHWEEIHFCRFHYQMLQIFRLQLEVLVFLLAWCNMAPVLFVVSASFVQCFCEGRTPSISPSSSSRVSLEIDPSSFRGPKKSPTTSNNSNLPCLASMALTFVNRSRIEPTAGPTASLDGQLSLDHHSDEFYQGYLHFQGRCGGGRSGGHACFQNYSTRSFSLAIVSSSHRHVHSCVIDKTYIPILRVMDVKSV